MIIGLTGFQGVGKDTTADILVREHHYEKRAIADRIRDALEALDPFVEADVRLSNYLGLFGWDVAKRTPPQGAEVRRLMQRYGDTVKTIAGQDVFVKATLHDLTGAEDVVISDVRYPNEANAIAALGGVIWDVVRPHMDVPAATRLHPSDKALIGYPTDAVITNNGDEMDLAYEVSEHLAIAGWPA